jgi:gas vesicle protein
MADQNQLQIVIEAVNKASKELSKISGDVDNLSDSASKAGKEAGTTAKTGFDKLKEAALAAGNSAGITGGQLGNLASAAMSVAPQIMLAVAALYALTRAAQAVVGFIRESIPEFTEYQSVMMGLSSTSAAFGESQKGARDAAISLTEDGLISVTTAANGLKSILSTGLELDKAIELMEAYKDEASFGRASTIELDDAVANLAESFKTENSMIGNLSGQVENYNYIIKIGATMLGKRTAELTRAEREEAKYLGTLEVAAKAQGDASRYAETYQGQQAKLNMVMKELRIEMGQYLIPVLEALTRWKLRLAESAKALTPVMKALAKAFLVVAQGAVQATNAVKGLISVSAGLGKDIGNSLRGGFGFKNTRDALESTASEMLTTWDDFGEAWEGINNTTLQDIERAIAESMLGMEEEVSDSAKKMADAWEKYQHVVKAATEDYERRLEELAISHRDTYEQIKKDIEEEKKLHDEKLQERKDRFEDTMQDLKERHGEKTQSILDDIQDERDAMQGQIDEIASEWNSLISLTEKAGNIRLATLQKQLAKEVALGENADQEKVTSLEQMIANGKKALEEATQNQEDAKQEEVNEVKSATQEKIEELERELEEERSRYQGSIADKKEAYNKDVDNYRKAHEDKLATLEEKLEEEKQVRERHRKLFEEIGNKQMEDDITLLKESHERRLGELEYQYEKQIESLRDMENKKTNIIKEAEEEQQEAIKETNKQLEESFRLFSSRMDNLPGIVKQSSVAQRIADDPFLSPSWFTGYQHGGIVSSPSIVGEKNYPEVVLPLGEPGRMKKILDSLGAAQGGGKVEQHFHVTVNSVADVDTIMERAAFNAKYK